ncbi:DarT ssDNA thymidine ADP-ribosyltransferase family protein [Pseudomonas cremoricolorata]|uniref:DarT ssDNA thymidine ADP-ribosyltransferase family protein n=1 Tax=Pseudomonas cremoricolorata TaxID=157783 RepID=UPI00248067F0|nr:DarT ssDNA thymidine ADP-ribosyltransferase family protein [Pseudomonas cremoricolorata]
MAYGYHLLQELALAIRDQKFIYHLTSLRNVRSILQRGLLPRSLLGAGFADIADQQIIEGRRRAALEQFVPFHWFAKNPFDGRVHRDRPDEHFVLIAVTRAHAKQNNLGCAAATQRRNRDSCLQPVPCPVA